MVSCWQFWGAAGAGLKGGSPRVAGGALRRHDLALVVAGLGLSWASPCCRLGPCQLSPAPRMVPTGTGGLSGRQLSLSPRAVMAHGVQTCPRLGVGARLRAPGWHCPGVSSQRDPCSVGQGRPCQGWPLSPRARALALSGWWDAPGMAAVEGVQPGWGLRTPASALQAPVSCPVPPATAHGLERGAWISISLFIRGVNTPV